MFVFVSFTGAQYGHMHGFAESTVSEVFSDDSNGEAYLKRERV